MKPNLLIRCEVPAAYLEQIEARAGKVYVEDWPPEAKEPAIQAPLEEIDIIVTRGLTDSLSFIDKTPRLQWVHSITVGVEKTAEAIKQREVVLTNIKGLNAVPISEYVIGAIFCWNRGFHTFIKMQQAKVWQTIAVQEAMGSTIGIIGYGNIGREVAIRSKALGMKVMASSRTVKAPDDLVDHYVTSDQISDLLKRSDVVVNCLPHAEANLHYMNRQKFMDMKKSALFINVGRGMTVDEHALISCLKEGRIAGAVLDVFEQEPLPPDHPFWVMEQVIVSPHNAFASPKHYDRVFKSFIENLDRFMNKDDLYYVIDASKGY